MDKINIIQSKKAPKTSDYWFDLNEGVLKRFGTNGWTPLFTGGGESIDESKLVHTEGLEFISGPKIFNSNIPIWFSDKNSTSDYKAFLDFNGAFMMETPDPSKRFPSILTHVQHTMNGSQWLFNGYTRNNDDSTSYFCAILNPLSNKSSIINSGSPYLVTGKAVYDYIYNSDQVVNTYSNQLITGSKYFSNYLYFGNNLNSTPQGYIKGYDSAVQIGSIGRDGTGSFSFGVDGTLQMHGSGDGRVHGSYNSLSYRKESIYQDATTIPNGSGVYDYINNLRYLPLRSESWSGGVIHADIRFHTSTEDRTTICSIYTDDDVSCDNEFGRYNSFTIKQPSLNSLSSGRFKIHSTCSDTDFGFYIYKDLNLKSEAKINTFSKDIRAFDSDKGDVIVTSGAVKEYIDNKLEDISGGGGSIDESNIVHKSDDETISGIKTFTDDTNFSDIITSSITFKGWADKPGIAGNQKVIEFINTSFDSSEIIARVSPLSAQSSTIVMGTENDSSHLVTAKAVRDYMTTFINNIITPNMIDNLD